MELLRQELGERPTAERALRSLGEAVGLSRSTIRRRLRSAPVTIDQKDIERRVHIHSVALEMRSYGYRPITKELRRRGATDDRDLAGGRVVGVRDERQSCVAVV